MLPFAIPHVLTALSVMGSGAVLLLDPPAKSSSLELGCICMGLAELTIMSSARRVSQMMTPSNSVTCYNSQIGQASSLYCSSPSRGLP